MFYVYILKSTKKDICYIGYTNNLKRRLAEHNKGKSSFTARYVPWILVYYEAFRNIDDAKEREFRLKKYGQSYTLLKKRLTRSLDI